MAGWSLTIALKERSHAPPLASIAHVRRGSAPDVHRCGLRRRTDSVAPRALLRRDERFARRCLGRPVRWSRQLLGPARLPPLVQERLGHAGLRPLLPGATALSRLCAIHLRAAGVRFSGSIVVPAQRTRCTRTSGIGQRSGDVHIRQIRVVPEAACSRSPSLLTSRSSFRAFGKNRLWLTGARHFAVNQIAGVRRGFDSICRPRAGYGIPQTFLAMQFATKYRARESSKVGVHGEP